MQVYLRKDIPGVGLAGEIIKVKDGYAANFLLPRKLGIEITSKNEAFYRSKQKEVEHRKEVIASETSMLAERIKGTKLVLKRKLHDDDRLYASVRADEVADLMAEHGFKIAKNQVKIDKAIKEKGTYHVTIKLSSRLQPHVTLLVTGE